MSRRLELIVYLGLSCAGCNAGAATGPGQQVPGLPVETAAPNASNQRPAFEGQTRAPFRSAAIAFDVYCGGDIDVRRMHVAGRR